MHHLQLADILNLDQWAANREVSWPEVQPGSRQPEIVPVLVLKQKHTGSTWFVQLLNSLPATAIRREFIKQAQEMKNASTARLAKRMQDGLSAVPQGFASQCSQHNLENGVCRAGFSMGVINGSVPCDAGVTESLPHGMKPVWHRMPSTRLLLLVRSNVMKSALDQLHDHASQVVDVRRVLDSAWLRLNMNRFFLKLSTASPLWEKSCRWSCTMGRYRSTYR